MRGEDGRPLTFGGGEGREGWVSGGAWAAAGGLVEGCRVPGWGEGSRPTFVSEPKKLISSML